MPSHQSKKGASTGTIKYAWELGYVSSPGGLPQIPIAQHTLSECEGAEIIHADQ
jgi:hypothetical protein